MCLCDEEISRQNRTDCRASKWRFLTLSFMTQYDSARLQQLQATQRKRTFIVTEKNWPIPNRHVSSGHRTNLHLQPLGPVKYRRQEGVDDEVADQIAIAQSQCQRSSSSLQRPPEGNQLLHNQTASTNPFDFRVITQCHSDCQSDEEPQDLSPLKCPGWHWSSLVLSCQTVSLTSNVIIQSPCFPPRNVNISSV